MKPSVMKLPGKAGYQIILSTKDANTLVWALTTGRGLDDRLDRIFTALDSVITEA